MAAMTSLFCDSFAKAPRRLVLEIDETEGRTYGGQQLSLVIAHHDSYCFMAEPHLRGDHGQDGGGVSISVATMSNVAPVSRSRALRKLTKSQLTRFGPSAPRLTPKGTPCRLAAAYPRPSLGSAPAISGGMVRGGWKAARNCPRMAAPGPLTTPAAPCRASGRQHRIPLPE